MYRNSEGYADPTAGAALAHITYEERKKKSHDERIKRNAGKKRATSAQRKNRCSSQKCQNHWIKVWPKEQTAKPNFKCG